MEYLIVIEKTANGFSAYSPDLPGCIATGSTRRLVARNMQKAIEFHVDGLRKAGASLPEPNSYPAYVKIPA